MSTISAGTTSGTALVNSGDTTGQLVLQTNGTTTAVTIGTNQVVTLAQPLPVGSGGTGSTTGVNLATGATGTLGVANGGTGATSLTANNVLLGNGTSAVQVVAPGSSGNVLTSNGTTWTSAAAAGGAWVFLTSVTANGAATADVENAFNAYDMYVIVGTGIRLSTNATFDARLKVAGAYQTTNYLTINMYATDASASIALDKPTTYMSILRSNISTTYTLGQFVMYIPNPATTERFKNVMYEASAYGFTSNVVQKNNGASCYNGGNGEELTGVRFFSSGGANITGTFRLYGIRNS